MTQTQINVCIHTYNMLHVLCVCFFPFPHFSAKNNLCSLSFQTNKENKANHFLSTYAHYNPFHTLRQDLYSKGTFQIIDRISKKMTAKIHNRSASYFKILSFVFIQTYPYLNIFLFLLLPVQHLVLCASHHKMESHIPDLFLKFPTIYMVLV